MSSSNGSSVTRAELAAHIKSIDERFEAVHDYAKETRDDVRELRAETKAGFKSIADSQWLGPQGRTFIAGAGLLSALAAIVIAILH